MEAASELQAIAAKWKSLMALRDGLRATNEVIAAGVLNATILELERHLGVYSHTPFLLRFFKNKKEKNAIWPLGRGQPKSSAVPVDKVFDWVLARNPPPACPTRSARFSGCDVTITR